MHQKAISILALVAGIVAIPATALATTEPGGAEDPAFCTDYLGLLEVSNADEGPTPSSLQPHSRRSASRHRPTSPTRRRRSSMPPQRSWAVTRKQPALRSSVRRSRISTTGHSTTAPSTPRLMSPRSTGHSVASLSKCPPGAWRSGSRTSAKRCTRWASCTSSTGSRSRGMRSSRSSPRTSSTRPTRPNSTRSGSATRGCPPARTRRWPTPSSSLANMPAFCMVPIGTNQDMSEQDMEELAVPGYEAHWQHGMLQEFTVIEAG